MHLSDAWVQMMFMNAVQGNGKSGLQWYKDYNLVNMFIMWNYINFMYEHYAFSDCSSFAWFTFACSPIFNHISHYTVRNIQNNQFTGWIPNKLKSIHNLKWVAAGLSSPPPSPSSSFAWILFVFFLLMITFSFIE